MNGVQTILAAVLLIASVITFILAGLAWRRKSSPGQVYFSLLMAAVGVWALGYLLELASPGVALKHFWVNVQYLGIATVPALWYLFASRFTGLVQRRFSAARMTALFSIPFITLVLSWTTPLQGWLRYDLSAPAAGFGELGKSYGPWFWVQVVYGYGLLLAGTALFIRGIFSAQSLFRKHRLVAIAAALLPWVGNALYISGVVRSFDLSPIAFSLSGLLAALAFFRLRLMDLAPVARDAIMESLDEGVLVMDVHDRIIDINPAAAAIFRRERDWIVGKDALYVFSKWPEFCAVLQSPQLSGTLQVNLRERWYDLRVEPVNDLRGRALGRMVVIRDFTALRQAEARLRQLNEELEQRVVKRTEELSSELASRRQAEAALTASEERYALAARGANDGLWDWDLESNFVFYSARWCEIFEVEGGDMVGTLEEWLGRVHPDDADRVRRELDAHLRGDSATFDSEHRIQTNKPEEEWVQARGLAIFNKNRAPVRMAGSFSDITQHKKAEAQLVYNALHDALTGLPNRALFQDRLGQAIERLRRNPAYQFAVLYLDFDRFKLVNDSLGHNIGDMLLISSGRRLVSAVRAIDTVARLGGDEFVLLLDGVNGVEDAIIIAERIQRDFGVVFQLDGYQVYNSASIGIVLSQEDYRRPDEVLRDADIAMYQAKLQGRSRYAIFDTSMRERTRTRLEIETDLRHALDRHEFALHYQPLVELGTGRLRGFEALLRWKQPGHIEVPPSDFIPVAEETGLILPIGHWVLREAIQQLVVWRGRHPEAQELTISVNVSARQLAQGVFAAEVESILTEAGLPATALRLEITETALLEENEIVRAALTRLRDMGVSLHLDDFGTGYSSLSYLHRYKVDALKIDRSFIVNMQPASTDEEIVRTILSLAHELKLEVCAEGVETSEQMEILQSLNCGFGQGFWIGKPVDPDSAETLIKPNIPFPAD